MARKRAANDDIMAFIRTSGRNGRVNVTLASLQNHHDTAISVSENKRHELASVALNYALKALKR